MKGLLWLYFSPSDGEEIRPDDVAPFEVRHIAYTGSTGICVLSCRISDCPRELPPFLATRKIQVVAVINGPGDHSLEIGHEEFDYHLGAYEEIQFALSCFLS
jgi:hypothetical protein